MMGEFICADCMEYLPTFADGEFDLAITDPPYGGGGLEMTPWTLSTEQTDASVDCSPAISLAVKRGGGRFDAYAKRQVWTDGRDMGDEVPDERGYL